MTILICGDGQQIKLAKIFLQKMSLFKDPAIASAGSYTLKCKARSDVVNLFLGRVYDESDDVVITENNFADLKSLCDELGFSGLDDELGTFERSHPEVTLRQKVRDLEELVDDCDVGIEEVENELRFLKESHQKLEEKVATLTKLLGEKEKREIEFQRQLMNSNGRIEDLQQQLRELASEKTKFESEMREFVEQQIKSLRESRKQFVCAESNKLDGVVAYLTRKCGGNVHDKGVIDVTASSVYGRPEHAVDFDVGRGFYKSRVKGGWICYNFKDRRVIPKSYTLKTFGDPPGGAHLKSWVIEVSNDGTSWAELDKRQDNEDLNHGSAAANFKISRVSSEAFQFIRLRQTGPNHEGNDRLYIACLEIFGIVRMSGQESKYIYSDAKPLDGIIADLTRKCGGNVHKKGIVTVTGIPIDRSPRNAVDFGTNAFYESIGEPNSWICYDFKDRRLIPTSYSVRSNRDSPGWCHLKSWVIEVSNDGSSWTEIDRRDDNNDLNDKSVTVNFKISYVPSESFRFLRLRQTGKDHHGTDYLSCSALEVFGTLLE